MAQFHERRMLLAAKIEAVEGTVDAPAGSDANILIYDATFEAEIDQFERRPLQQQNRPYSSIRGGQRGKVRFKVELKGSGAAGTAPAIGKLLKAAGFGETVTPATSVAYDPIIVAIPTLTIDVFSLPESGNHIRERLSGCRCSKLSLPAKIGEPGMLEMEFSGVYAATADNAGLSPSGLETTKPPALLSAAFSIQSFSPKVTQIGLDVGIAGAYRGDLSLAAGYLSYAITEHKPMLSFDPEKDLVATHDYYGILNAMTEAAMSYAFGATAGNICTISGPKAQYTKVTPGSRGGLGIFNVEAKLNASSGNDALKFLFT